MSAVAVACASRRPAVILHGLRAAAVSRVSIKPPGAGSPSCDGEPPTHSSLASPIAEPCLPPHHTPTPLPAHVQPAPRPVTPDLTPSPEQRRRYESWCRAGVNSWSRRCCNGSNKDRVRALANERTGMRAAVTDRRSSRSCRRRRRAACCCTARCASRPTGCTAPRCSCCGPSPSAWPTCELMPDVSTSSRCTCCPSSTCPWLCSRSGCRAGWATAIPTTAR